MIRLSGTARDARRQTTVGLVVEQLRRPVPGGIGSYARGLVRGLAELGEQGAPPLALLASRMRRAALTRSPLAAPLDVRARLAGSAPAHPPGRSGSWRRSAAGLVHATSFDVPPCDCPLVVTVHDLLWRELPDAYSRHGRAWHEAALRRAVRRAAAFVVPSVRAVADDLVGERPRHRTGGRSRSSPRAPTTSRRPTSTAHRRLLGRARRRRASSCSRSGPASRGRTSPGSSPPTAPCAPRLAGARGRCSSSDRRAGASELGAPEGVVLARPRRAAVLAGALRRRPRLLPRLPR